MWKDLLALSRREQKGFFYLTAILFIVFIVFIYVLWFSGSDERFVILTSSPDNPDTVSTVSDKQEPASVSITFFNPNTVSIKQLEELGLKPRTILNWKKYLEAHGTFKCPDDLYKIFSIDSSFVQRVAPYLVFDDMHLTPSSEKKDYRQQEKCTWINLNKISRNELEALNINEVLRDSILLWQAKYWFTKDVNSSQINNLSLPDFAIYIHSIASPKRLKSTQYAEYSFEINHADTAQLNLLKGIGPVLARRIIYYRQKLGGFYSLHQLMDVEGISPQTMELIKPNLTVNPSLIAQLNVNKVSLRKLKEHPYIGYYKAKEIIDFRQKEGPFQSLDQVFGLHSFKSDDITILKYYLTL
jgi:DNA uptake protein ComE-like DNA-binding protein